MIRVLVVEDARLMRAAIVTFLSLEEGIEVVGVAAGNEEAVRLAIALQPDVTLIDIDSLSDAPDLAIRLHERFPQSRILFLAGTRPPKDLGLIGAAGFGLVLKGASPARLVEGVRRTAAGERFVDPEVVWSTLNAPCPLTTRELEVLGLAAEGGSVTEIAARLFLSVGTVRNYLASSTSKIGARTRIDAIRIAREAGWL